VEVDSHPEGVSQAVHRLDSVVEGEEHLRERHLDLLRRQAFSHKECSSHRQVSNHRQEEEVFRQVMEGDELLGKSLLTQKAKPCK